MKSPFPGMDPYLEQPAVWAGFHNAFLAQLHTVISSTLNDDYDAHLESDIRVVDAPPIDAGDYRPDISVSRLSELQTSASSSEGIALLEPPVVLPLSEPTFEEVNEYRIDIYRFPGEELVTTIELLSPWNKTGEGFVDFARKRRAMLKSPVNWVEIDLLIAGDRVPFGGPPRDESDYRVVIARSAMRPNAELYPWNLRDSIPKIKIPLREPDPPIIVSLDEIFAMTYDRGRFDKPLRRLPQKPLRVLVRAEDREWARELALER